MLRSLRQYTTENDEPWEESYPPRIEKNRPRFEAILKYANVTMDKNGELPEHWSWVTDRNRGMLWGLQYSEDWETYDLYVEEYNYPIGLDDYDRDPDYCEDYKLVLWEMGIQYHYDEEDDEEWADKLVELRENTYTSARYAKLAKTLETDVNYPFEIYIYRDGRMGLIGPNDKIAWEKPPMHKMVDTLSVEEFQQRMEDFCQKQVPRFKDSEYMLDVILRGKMINVHYRECQGVYWGHPSSLMSRDVCPGIFCESRSFLVDTVENAIIVANHIEEDRPFMLFVETQRRKKKWFDWDDLPHAYGDVRPRDKHYLWAEIQYLIDEDAYP